MAKLSEDVKVFIVQQIAAYEPPSVVADLVRKEFGIEITRQQVHDHNPLGSKGPHIAKKWKVMFEKARKRFERDVSDIPISHKAYRLKRYDRIARTAEQRGNARLALDATERAAKEMGCAYINPRQITGKDGRPVEFCDVSRLTDEQLDAEIKALLGGEGDDAR